MSIDIWIEGEPQSGRFQKMASVKCEPTNDTIGYSDRCLFAKVTFEFKGELIEASPYHKFIHGRCIICNQKEKTA